MDFDMDEREEWQGKPKQGILFTSYDIFLIPFSFLWFGGAIIWELMVLSSKAPDIYKLWGIPFILVGLYFTLGRFIHDSIIRENTKYVVTNKRIIIKKFNKIESISKGNWASLKLEEFADGTGNIFFAEPLNFSFRMNWTMMLSSNLGVPAFFRIQNAREVYSLLVD